MPAKPLISVIIAVYNGSTHLEEQMDALLAQRCDFVWEAIYVDNGSRDNSRELIKRRIEAQRLTHVRLVDGSQHPGQVYARNFGAVQAQADLLAYTDQDDLPAPDWLVALNATLQQADAVGGFVVRTPDGRPPANNRNEIPADTRFLLRFGGFDCAIGTNFAIHRRVLDAVGGWQDLAVHAGEDIDLCIRLHVAGYRLAYAPDARVTWRSRSTIRDIFNQAVTYGRSSVQLYVRHRTNGIELPTVRSSLRAWKHTLRALPGFISKPRSYRFVHLFGLKCGTILEGLRGRTFEF